MVATMSLASCSVQQFTIFALKKMEYQFFLPNTKAPYMAITDNGYIVDYKTNEFIPLE